MKGWFGESYRHYLAGKGYVTQGYAKGSIMKRRREEYVKWKEKVEKKIEKLPDIPKRSRIVLGGISVPSREYELFPEYKRLIDQRVVLSAQMKRGPAAYKRKRSEMSEVNRQINLWSKANVAVRPEELFPQKVVAKRVKSAVVKRAKKKEKSPRGPLPVDVSYKVWSSRYRDLKKKGMSDRAIAMELGVFFLPAEEMRMLDRRWAEREALLAERTARRRVRDAAYKRKVRAKAGGSVSKKVQFERMRAVRAKDLEEKGAPVVKERVAPQSPPSEEVVRSFEEKGIEVLQ